MKSPSLSRQGRISECSAAFPMKIAVQIPQGAWEQPVENSESHLSELTCDLGSSDLGEEPRVRKLVSSGRLRVEALAASGKS